MAVPPIPSLDFAASTPSQAFANFGAVNIAYPSTQPAVIQPRADNGGWYGDEKITGGVDISRFSSSEILLAVVALAYLIKRAV